ncbi:uncharacterized protein LOC122254404 isoform X2 [Penaeus japonicus]|nr:uncharacterized protein LOC122254404 isoform X2 [Penaeus japonicus]
MDGSGVSCNIATQTEVCHVSEEGQETFIEVFNGDERPLASEDTAVIDLYKTVGQPSPGCSDSFDVADSSIPSISNVQDPLELPSSELENRSAFSGSQVSDSDERLSPATNQLSNSRDTPASSDTRVTDPCEKVSPAAGHLFNSSEKPKVGCDVSTGTATSCSAIPVQKRRKFSKEECYNTSIAFQKEEHELIMSVQQAKLKVQEAKLKHLEKQALIDTEKLRQMEAQSLINTNMLQSINKWKEVAVSVQETVKKGKNFWHLGGSSTLHKDSTVGPSPVTEPSVDGSVLIKPNENHSSVLESLYDDSAFADVTLIAQGQSVRAHRAVLSAKSPYFREVLQANPCQHPIIIMPLDMQYRDLQAIISYIYKGEVTLPSENLKSLLKTANALQISGLSKSDVLGNTTNDGEDEPSSKPAVELPSKGVDSESATFTGQYTTAEDTHIQSSSPVRARKGELHSSDDCILLSSRKKRPRYEDLSEAEAVTLARTHNKTPRLAEIDNHSVMLNRTSVLEDIKVEDFEEHKERPEDYPPDDYDNCDMSRTQSEHSPSAHFEATDSIIIKEEPFD